MEKETVRKIREFKGHKKDLDRLLQPVLEYCNRNELPFVAVHTDEFIEDDDFFVVSEKWVTVSPRFNAILNIVQWLLSDLYNFSKILGESPRGSRILGSQATFRGMINEKLIKMKDVVKFYEYFGPDDEFIKEFK